MNEISEDVMKTAREIIAAEVPRDIRWQYVYGRHDHHAAVRAICNAILAERNRCASIANLYAKKCQGALCHYGSADKDEGRGRQEGSIKAGEEIAAAIRSGQAS